MVENPQSRLHAIVEGLVQGVGFRYFVQENANRLGLTGWVRNRADGKVEVTAEGEREALGKLLNKLHRGPRSAYVIKVNAEWHESKEEFTRFDVRSTA
jgi:acylphosphatase